MRVVAYCAASFRGSTRRAAGVEPLTSPPYVDAPLVAGGYLQFRPALVAGADLLYLALHGQEWLSEWIGDERIVALRAETLVRCDLAGAVVFAESCWLPESDMLAALFEAGAQAVVGGSGENYGGARRLAGVSLLGRWFRLWLGLGLGPAPALWLAKARALVTPGANRADLLGFRVFEVRR